MDLNRYNITHLPNGVRVISEHIPYVKSFSLGFWFNVGSRDENEQNNGISHFLEHMFFKGTEKRSAKKMADEIESLGGYLNAFTSKEHTCYYGRGLSHHIEKTFAVLSDMIQNPLFKEGDIEKESSVVVDELFDIEDSPDELIFDKFESNIYKGNTLRYPIIGTEKNIRGFSRDDLFNYVGSKYGLNNLYIVASGNVDHNQLLKMTDKYITDKLGIIKKQRRAPKIKSVEDVLCDKSVQQTHVIIGKPTYGYKDKRSRTVVSVLSHILGDGSSSRLFQALRERNGITYQVNSFINSFNDISSFGIYFSTNDKMVNKALGLVEKEFDKMTNKPVTQKELKRAKEYLKGTIMMGLESTTNRMLRIAQSMIYFNRIVPMEETIQEIDSVTFEDIERMSRELLNREALSKAIISSNNELLQSAA